MHVIRFPDNVHDTLMVLAMDQENNTKNINKLSSIEYIGKLPIILTGANGTIRLSMFSKNFR